jgi:rhomboid family protein
MAFPAADEQEFPRMTPAVRAIIALNVVVLFLQMTVGNFADASGLLGFDSSALPGRWWAVVTYMFVHAGVWHLVANMFALFVFGPRMEHAWGTKRFVWFYVLCGCAGALFQVTLVRSGELVGASAAVFGVMTAYAMQWPNEEIYLFGILPMRVRTLVSGLFAFNLVMGVLGTSGSSGGTNVAYVAHLGGIIAAYAYMRLLATGGMDQVRQRVANLPDADEPPRAIPRALPRSRDRGDEVDDVVAKSKALSAKRTASLPPAPRERAPRGDELNRMLDKISQQGIQSLTSDERQLLEEMSRRLKGS